MVCRGGDVARHRPQLFALLYLRAVEMYLRVLDTDATTDAAAPVRAFLQDMDTVAGAWTSVDVMISVLLDQRSAHRYEARRHDSRKQALRLTDQGTRGQEKDRQPAGGCSTQGQPELAALHAASQTRL